MVPLYQNGIASFNVKPGRCINGLHRSKKSRSPKVIDRSGYNEQETLWSWWAQDGEAMLLACFLRGLLAIHGPKAFPIEYLQLKYINNSAGLRFPMLQSKEEEYFLTLKS